MGSRCGGGGKEVGGGGFSSQINCHVTALVVHIVKYRPIVHIMKYATMIADLIVTTKLGMGSGAEGWRCANYRSVLFLRNKLKLYNPMVFCFF